MEKKTANEISLLKMDYNSNKNKVIEFLIENVLDVDMTIPDVVKGKFTIS
jgi:hypothetical protein